MSKKTDEKKGWWGHSIHWTNPPVLQWTEIYLKTKTNSKLIKQDIIYKKVCIIGPSWGVILMNP